MDACGGFLVCTACFIDYSTKNSSGLIIVTKLKISATYERKVRHVFEIKYERCVNFFFLPKVE